MEGDVAGTRGVEDARVAVETFDAVVVCNGHYSEPPRTREPAHMPRECMGYERRTFAGGPDALAQLQDAGRHVRGSEEGGGAGRHGQRRGPEPGDRHRGVRRGAGRHARAILSREIAVVRRGALAKNDFPVESYPKNATLKPGIVELIPERSGVRFEDGSVEEDVDVILYATGYQYAFPFLSDAGGAGVRRRQLRLAAVQARVSPALAPSLSFIGLPWKVVPFPQFETQARWIAKALSGAAPLPPRREMLDDADAFEGVWSRRESLGGTRTAWATRSSRTTTSCARCASPPLATWRAEMYAATGARKRSQPASYRDGPIPWSDEVARLAARAEATAAGFGTDPARDEVEVRAA